MLWTYQLYLMRNVENQLNTIENLSISLFLKTVGVVSNLRVEDVVHTQLALPLLVEEGLGVVSLPSVLVEASSSWQLDSGLYIVAEQCYWISHRWQYRSQFLLPYQIFFINPNESFLICGKWHHLTICL